MKNITLKNIAILISLVIVLLVFGCNTIQAQPASKPVPEMQIIPQPYEQTAFFRNGAEIARYHFGSQLHRPFIFPVIGPSGLSLTRMGHPHDPNGHSHHNGVWVSHHIINGINFWGDTGEGKIVHKGIVKYIDDGGDATIIAENHWVDGDKKALLQETRSMTTHPLPDKEWRLIIDLKFKAVNGDVKFEDTPFGMIGVRMAKTIGVHDGSGMIRNAEGAMNEKAIFRKKTRWVDYSGRITNDAIEGITLFDHPMNPNHPAPFHVRNDGWMGACLNHEAPFTLKNGNSIKLRYGLYIHSDFKPIDDIERQWKEFTEVD